MPKQPPAPSIIILDTSSLFQVFNGGKNLEVSSLKTPSPILPIKATTANSLSKPIAIADSFIIMGVMLAWISRANFAHYFFSSLPIKISCFFFFHLCTTLRAITHKLASSCSLVTWVRWPKIETLAAPAAFPRWPSSLIEKPAFAKGATTASTASPAPRRSTGLSV